MGWKRASVNPNTVQTIICSKCKQPLDYVKKADNPQAFDFPLRTAPHECVKKRKHKEIKVYSNSYLNRR